MSENNYVMGIYGGGSGTHIAPHIKIGQKVRDTSTGNEYRVVGRHVYADDKSLDYPIFLMDGDYFQPTISIIPGESELSRTYAVEREIAQVKAKTMFACPASIFFSNYEKVV